MRDQEQIVVGGGPSIVAPWLGVRYLLDFASRQAAEGKHLNTSRIQDTIIVVFPTLKKEEGAQFSSSSQAHLKLIGEVPVEDARQRVNVPGCVPTDAGGVRQQVF